nr:uncharacterized protein LOC122272323 [Parasteatoda tepidariorum]
MPAGASAPGRVTQAGQVGGETPDKEEPPGPPGWGLGVGLTTPPRKNQHVSKSKVVSAELPSCNLTRKRSMEMRFGYWNIRTLYQSKNLQLLIEQMDSYRLDLLAIQEIRWTGSGVLEKRRHTLSYSRHKTKHLCGTGFILNKRLSHPVIDFQAISPRLCLLRLKGSFANYSIINVYAPTEEGDEEKDNFYDELDRL